MGLVTGRAAAVPAQGGSSEDFATAWVRALDDLELEVDRAEQLLSAEHSRTSEVVADPGHAPWVAPQLRGTPLPDTLRERAERLLERQLTVTGRLAVAMTSSRRHMDVVERLVPSDPRPMYVDQAM